MKATQQLLFRVLWLIHDCSQQTHQLFMGECVHGTHRFLPGTRQQNSAEEMPVRELLHGSDQIYAVQLPQISAHYLFLGGT